MAENAGSIYAEIRLKIDELKKGGMEAQQYIEKLEARIKKGAARTGETAGAGILSGIKKGLKGAGEEVAQLTAGIVKKLSLAFLALTAAIKTVQAIGGALRDAFMSNEKFREGIENLKSALGESFSAAVRPVANFFAGIIDSAARAIKEANALKEAIRRLREGVEDYGNTLSEEYRNTKQDYEALGKEIAALQNKIDNAHGHGRSGITGWRQQLNELIPRYGELGKKLEELERITGDAGADSLKKFEDIEKELADAEAQISLLHEKKAMDDKEADQARLSALDNYINAVGKLAAENGISSGIVTDGLEKQIARYNDLESKIEKQKKAANLLNQARETYRATLAQIQNQEEAGFIKTDEAMSQRLAAEQQYIKTLSGLRDEYTKLEGTESRQAANIAALEAAHIAEAAALQTVVDYQKTYTAETGRLRADYEQISAEMGSEASFASLMASEAEKRAAELEKGRDAELAALNTRYAAIAASRESGELTKEEINHRAMLTEAINQNYNALQQLAKTASVTAAQEGIVQYSREIDEEYQDITRQLAEQEIKQNEILSDKEKELALNELSRNAALAELNARFAELEAQRGGLGLTEEEIALRDTLTRKINENHNAVASGIRDAEKEVIDFKGAAMQIAQAGVSAFTSIASAMSTIAQQEAQAAMEKIDKTLEEELKKIKEAREAALVEEGFMEARRAEDMEAQINAAKEVNDEVLEYQLRRRQREMEINEEYDALVKAQEDKAKKEKAEEEYKAAKVKYEMDMTNAIVTGALAITQAMASGWGAGFPMGPILAGVFGTAATVAAGAQIAVIASNPPKMPAFATGGIVPGQPHANADTVAAMVSPGEVILNRAQQETLAQQLAERPLIIQNHINGRIISEVVVKDYINKGIVIIEAKRGIR